MAVGNPVKPIKIKSRNDHTSFERLHTVQYYSRAFLGLSTDSAGLCRSLFFSFLGRSSTNIFIRSFGSHLPIERPGWSSECPQSPTALVTVMASLSQLRHAPRLFRGTTRLISSSSITRADASTTLSTGSIPLQKRPVGGFRGGYVLSCCRPIFVGCYWEIEKD